MRAPEQRDGQPSRRPIDIEDFVRREFAASEGFETLQGEIALEREFGVFCDSAFPDDFDWRTLPTRAKSSVLAEPRKYARASTWPIGS